MMRDPSGKILFLMPLTLLAGSLAACGGKQIEAEARYPTGYDRAITNDDIYAKPESIFGPDGISILGGGKDKSEDSGIGVNSFLWRASLDTVSFMPLASADPFGGVILTDWYSPPETPDKRFKVDVFILSRELRSDGIRVRVFKQQRSGGTWRDDNVSDDTAFQLENAILTRARQLRVAQVER